MSSYKKVLIVRPDRLGDVALTLPVAGLIKQALPATRTAFLGSRYTKALVERCRFVDEFYDWDALQRAPVISLSAIAADVVLHIYPSKHIAAAAHAARIATRIGIANRWYNLFHCNRLIWLRRRNSPLHEAQLNLEFLKPLGIEVENIRLEQIPDFYGWTPSCAQPDSHYDLIFHPKSHGHGCEWPLERYLELAASLPQYRIAITGSHEEGQRMRSEQAKLFDLPHVFDLTGQLELPAFIAAIESTRCVLASGTGPIHIAAAAGVPAIGLYPQVRPIHSGRWGPIGHQATALSKGELSDDKSRMDEQMAAISSQEVQQRILDIVTP